MRTFIVGIFSLSLLSACSAHKRAFTAGPLRLQAQAAMIAKAGQPWSIDVILAGELPPAGAFCRWEVLVSGEDFPIQETEGIFYPTKRVYHQYVTFHESWYMEKVTYFTPPESGESPDSFIFQQKWDGFVQQGDPEAHVTVRFSLYDSINKKWKVAASVSRTVNVQCPQCPAPPTAPRRR